MRPVAAPHAGFVELVLAELAAALAPDLGLTGFTMTGEGVDFREFPFERCISMARAGSVRGADERLKGDRKTKEKKSDPRPPAPVDWYNFLNLKNHLLNKLPAS